MQPEWGSNPGLFAYKASALTAYLDLLLYTISQFLNLACYTSSLMLTVLVIIKLTKFEVAVQFHCVCIKLTFCLYFIIFCDV